MLPEPTFNSFLLLAAVLLAIGSVGLFVRRGATARLLCLLVMVNAAPLALVAADRYFGTSSGRLTTALVLFVGLVHAAAVATTVIAFGTRNSERE